MRFTAELQRAMYQRLSEGLAIAVYNHMPQGVKPPYVVVGAEWTSFPGQMETHDSYGAEQTNMVHVFDDSRGSLRVVRIMGDIECLLHGATLDLDGLAVAKVQKHPSAQSQVLQDQVDDRAQFWYHGIIRLVVWMSAVPVTR